MLRVRLHGRGGQGIKTASQILGTAAFQAGFQAQDFPLYGAERRGAPIVAYTRVDRDLILERGPISRPDILLVGDETLLEDPTALPLKGADSSTLLFINSTHAPDALKDHFSLPALPVQADLTELCLKYIGHRKVLSTALAAVGAKLMTDIGLEHLLEAVRMELGEGKINAEKLDSNLALAEELFHTLPSVQLDPGPETEAMQPNRQAQMALADIADAAPIILAPGNMGLRKTGNWRTHRPVINYDQCNHCGICYLRCPEGDVLLEKDGKPILDYEHCKGCLICAAECPKQAIEVIREVTSWN